MASKSFRDTASIYLSVNVRVATCVCALFRVFGARKWHTGVLRRAHVCDVSGARSMNLLRFCVVSAVCVSSAAPQVGSGVLQEYTYISLGFCFFRPQVAFDAGEVRDN